MRKTILLADPSPTIRRVVELSLAGAPVQVAAASDGRSALVELARLAPDLLVADAILGEPSGFELCRRIKQSARPVPVLLLRETFAPWDEHEAAACGADGHLIKPFDPAALARQVTALLERADDPDETRRREVDEALAEAGLAGPPAVQPVARSASAPTIDAALDEASLEALARLLVERLGEAAIRDIAREVVPRVAERVVRERLAELDRPQPAAGEGGPR